MIRLLKSVPFLRLWLGTTSSGLATWALPFVLGLAVIEALISPVTLGTLMGVRTLGFLVGVISGGVLADQFGGRLVVFVSGLIGALASPVLAYTLVGHGVWAHLVISVIGFSQGASRPAYQALVPQIVPEKQLQSANALITVAVRVTTLLGPATAALLSRIISIKGLIWLIGLAWFLSAILPIRMPRTESSEKFNIVEDVRIGIIEAGRHRWFVAGLVALIPVMALGFSATSVVFPSISKEFYGGDEVFAAAITAYTLGALLGGILMAYWKPINEGWVSLCGLALYSLASLVLLVLPDPILIYLAYAVGGVGIEIFNVPWFTATQREVAPDKLARVTSVDFLISYGLMPIGLAAYPWMVEEFGRVPVLLITVVLCASIPLLATLAPGTRYYHDPRVKLRSFEARE